MTVVDKYFTGAISRIEGMGLDEIAREVLAKHFLAFNRKEIPVERLRPAVFTNGNEKGNSIYSIPKPSICCSIRQR